MSAIYQPSNSSSPLSRQAELERLWQIADAASRRSVRDYLNQIVINSDPEPRAFRLVAEPWQWGIADLLAPAVELVSGARTHDPGQGPPPKKWFWLTLPKGHDKTTLIGRMLSWMLAYSRKPLRCYATAVDKDQAGLLPAAMKAESRLNPWLHKRLTYGNWKITGDSESELEILASETDSSRGLIPNVVVIDEITSWKKKDFFQSMVSGGAKRKHMMLVVITNAGILGSWQHEALLAAKRSSKWIVYEAPHKLAQWMSDETINELRQHMLPQEARRLFDNVWLDPSEGSGYVMRSEVERCEELGRSLALVPQYQGGFGHSYVASIDYGPVKDRTVLTILHHDKNLDCVVVDRMDVFQGSRKEHVAIEQVEQWLIEAMNKFNLDAVTIDPYQMESTIQKFQNRIPIEPFEARGGKSNYELAQTLRSLIVNGKLAWYPGCGDLYKAGHGGPHTLTDEFCELIVRQMGYGYRIDHLPKGHDDRVVSLGMGCCLALKSRPKRVLRDSEYYF